MELQTNVKNKKLRLPKIGIPNFSRKNLINLLLALIVIGGAYFTYNWYTNRKPSDNAYAYTYNKLSTISLNGTHTGSAMKFDRPIELQTGAVEPTASQVTMFQTMVKNNTPLMAAEISVASVYSGTDLSSEYLKNFNSQIVEPNNSLHASAIKPMKDFVNQRIAPNYTATFSEPKAFASSNIKTNAWYMTYSLTLKDKNTPTPGLNFPDMKGQVVMAVGKSAFYYVKLDTLKVNWTSNQTTWDKVFNSIKIDQ